MTRYETRIHPEMDIPPEASTIHKIYDKDVKDKPPFCKIARKVEKFLFNCDLAGYNFLKFDRQFLKEEFTRAEVPFDWEKRRIVDPYSIFRSKEPQERLSLENAYRFYCGREHTNAHSALGDARVCWEVLQAQLAKYFAPPYDIQRLHEFCTRPFAGYLDWARKFEWRYRQAAFAFGKHAGKLVKDVARDDPNYLHWMLREFDHLTNTKKIIRDALKGKFPKP